MAVTTIAVEAETITPFAYHSLMVQSGTATLPELIGDRALAFGLARTLGITAARVGLPAKDYRGHLSAMPYRTSVFVTDSPRLLPSLAKRLNLDAEAGLQKKIQDVAKKGNLKDFFYTQEVPAGQVFQGVVFGLDDFDLFGEANRDELVIRIGLHRSGMVRLRRANTPVPRVRLNVATAWLFGRELPMERYCLYEIQLTPWMEVVEAAQEVAQWSDHQTSLCGARPPFGTLAFAEGTPGQSRADPHRRGAHWSGEIVCLPTGYDTGREGSFR